MNPTYFAAREFVHAVWLSVCGLLYSARLLLKVVAA